MKSEEQVEKLRCQIRIISSRKNSPKRENSSNLYNSDNNITIITKLANAIDDYVDNLTIGKEILADQIKRTIRQIHQKENNLHQDLVCEQWRCYDAEAERNNEIIQR